MEVIEDIVKMQDLAYTLRSEGEIIGFVPTMGYLHEGHINLLNIARKDSTKVVMSIFVNPIQFGPNEDFERYPKDFEHDYKIAAKFGVDIIFYPKIEDMYKENFSTFVDVENLNSVMCGIYRPGHFRGVCTVVLKLFNIIYPHKAYFGQKDYQQLIIIKRMVRDLNLKIEIVECPTIRDKDGLALSSRNKYLSIEERKNATILYECLNLARKFLANKSKDIKEIKEIILKKFIESNFVTKVEYFDFRDAENLTEVVSFDEFYKNKPNGKILIASAIWIGKTRLIDNVIFEK